MTWMYQSQAITFDANFESGNLASAERTNEFEYDLFIQPDASTTTRMWFYFRCQNVPLNLPILFNIVGINKQNTTFSSQQRVLVRSSSRTKWQRIPTLQQFYTNSQKHRCYSSYPILSFLFQFDQQEEYFFAFGYPYTYSMLIKFLNRIRDHNLPFVDIKSLGQSCQQRDLQTITIGRPSSFSRYANNQVPAQTHTVLITARCHSGEFPGSYICHGILEYMLSNSPRAKFLRNNLQIKIIPMLNPDGVFAGFYRTNSAGQDLNRQFGERPSPALECNLVWSLFEQIVGPERPGGVGSFDASQLNNTLLQIATDNQIGGVPLVREDSESEASSTTQSANTNDRQQSNAKLGQQLKQAKDNILKTGAQLPPKSQSATAQGGKQRQSYEQALQEAITTQNNSVPHSTHLDFVIDLHSHSNQSGGFLFLNPDAYVFSREKRYRTEQVFPQLLAKNCAVFGSLQSSFKESQNIREGSLRRAFCTAGKQRLADDCPYIYCLEISNSHGPDPAEGGKRQLNIEEDVESSDADEDFENEVADQNLVIYTPAKYMQIGEKICDTLFEIYSKVFK